MHRVILPGIHEIAGGRPRGALRQGRDPHLPDDGVGLGVRRPRSADAGRGRRPRVLRALRRRHRAHRGRARSRMPRSPSSATARPSASGRQAARRTSTRSSRAEAARQHRRSIALEGSPDAGWLRDPLGGRAARRGVARRSDGRGSDRRGGAMSGGHFWPPRDPSADARLGASESTLNPRHGYLPFRSLRRILPADDFGTASMNDTARTFLCGATC